jgi:hypothetical protein
MWSQSLHIRDPQLGDAPPVLASELSELLHNMATTPVSGSSSTIVIPQNPTLPLARDVRHNNNVRIQQLIKEIRTMPGHENFMRGLPFEALAKCAAHSIVVVLVAAQNECHALVLQSDMPAPITIQLRDLALGDLTAMSVADFIPCMRSSTPDDVQHDRLGMGISSLSMNIGYSFLGKLWTMVVKPIFDFIGLQVCIIECFTS